MLFVCPTLAGHALDGDQPRLLAPLADLLHLGAAAVWLGGLASLLLAFPGADGPARTAAARRFSSFAIPMVLVLVAGGASRALTELELGEPALVDELRPRAAREVGAAARARRRSAGSTGAAWRPGSRGCGPCARRAARAAA